MNDGMGKREAFALILCGILVVFAVNSAIVSSAMYMLSEPDSQASGLTKEQVTEHMEKVSFHQVTVYYTSEEKPLLPLTKETLDYAANLNRIILGYAGSEHLDIIFFSNQKQIEAYSGLAEVAGFYSEQEKLIGIMPEEKKELLKENDMAVYLYQRLFIHEFTHYAFHQKLRELETDPDDFPLWFHEGTSEWTANYELVIDPVSFAVVPFEQLDTDENWQKARSAYQTDVYLQSFYMINELTGTFGEDIILKIMKKTSEVQNFEKGFKAATNESLTQFEKDFTHKYEKKKAALDTGSSAASVLMKALLSHASVIRRHLRLSLSRSECVQHILHILSIQLRNLIVSVFILIEKNFKSHFNELLNLG